MKRHFLVRLCLLGGVLVLLCACGIAGQPTAAGEEPPLPGLEPVAQTAATIATTPEPPRLLGDPSFPDTDPRAWPTTSYPTWQAEMAYRTDQAQRRWESESTARASGPDTPAPRPTFDPRPTKVSPRATPASSGYIIPLSRGQPFKYPIYKNVWLGSLPDGKRVVVYAGGFHSLAEHDTTLAVGALSVGIDVPRDTPGEPPIHSTDDPRIDLVILPVTDGYARVVDARMSGNQILVFVQTEGGSTYTYEVNTHTLTQTGGPTATPLSPGAPSPTLPYLAP